jgi:hypothetical protein
MNTPTVETPMYTIPRRFRIIENLHIVFWLFKDLAWCLLWRPLGVAMIVPTLCIAVYIVWQNRHIASELYHNLAVMFWIMANSFWMVSEFFKFDAKKVIFGIEGKHLAILPFTLGILCLIVYYGFIAPGEKRKVKEA